MNQPKRKTFQEWSTDTKVLDAEGKPLIVYHGTQAAFDTFDPECQGETVFSEDQGFFFTNCPAEASSYAMLDWDKANPKPNVMPVYLSIKNPMIIELRDFNSPYERPAIWYDHEGRDMVEKALAEGNDGLIVRDLREDVSDFINGTPLTLYVVFDPNQIAPAFGQFLEPPEDSHIWEQEEENSLSM